MTVEQVKTLYFYSIRKTSRLTFPPFEWDRILRQRGSEVRKWALMFIRNHSVAKQILLPGGTKNYMTCSLIEYTKLVQAVEHQGKFNI